MYTYSSIKNYIKINGWIHFLILPLRRIQLKLLVIERGFTFYFIPANIPEKKSDPSITVRFATIEDLDKLREISPNTTLFKDFMKKKDIFVIALSDEKVVGHICFAMDLPVKYKNFIRLQPDELWHREAFIHPEYRNKGIYSIIFSFAAQIAEQQGFSRVYSSINSNNQKSIEIHTKKFRFNPVFSYTYIKFLFFEKTWVSDVQN